MAHRRRLTILPKRNPGVLPLCRLGSAYPYTVYRRSFLFLASCSLLLLEMAYVQRAHSART